ncbi:MAG: DUF6754 domain-containing protein [Myxococcota bacterium]|nr:DUF6754 domain-containing protein [Myxococcota bacterium]
MIYLLWMLLCFTHAREALIPIESVTVAAPPNDSGTHLTISWRLRNDTFFHVVNDQNQIVQTLPHHARSLSISDSKTAKNWMVYALNDPSPSLQQVLAEGTSLSLANDTDNLSWSWPGLRQGYAVLRCTPQGNHNCEDHRGNWSVVRKGISPLDRSYEDVVSNNPLQDPIRERYAYRVVTLPVEYANDTKIDFFSLLLNYGSSSSTAFGTPQATWWKNIPGIYTLLFFIFGTGGLIFFFTAQAQRGKKLTIRKIPGIDAIEEGIGRATEMGKPVLYVPGIESLEDIQTIASMLILGEVSKTIAEYQSDVIVSCMVPIVREVADEVVKSGYYRAGHPDAYDPTSVRFISSDQFAFCAGTNGIMYRQKPATNIYLGRFFAESLILAETGFANKAIQIAGTAEVTQLPFFLAACDYTLIGEELFAVSAYLSDDPRLLSSLKASDWIKIVIIVFLSLGVIAASFGSTIFHQLLSISQG